MCKFLDKSIFEPIIEKCHIGKRLVFEITREINFNSDESKAKLRVSLKIKEMIINFAPYFIKSIYYIKKQIESYHFNNLGRNFNLIINNKLNCHLTISKDSSSKKVVDFCDNFEIKSHNLSEQFNALIPENKFEGIIKKIYETNSREMNVDFYKIIEKEIIENKKNENILEYEIKTNIIDNDDNNRNRRNLKDLHIKVDPHVFNFYSENFDNKKFFFCLNSEYNYYLKFKFNYFQNNKQVKISTNYSFKNNLKKKIFIKISRRHTKIRKNSSNPAFSKNELAYIESFASKIKRCTSQEKIEPSDLLLFEKCLNPEEKVKHVLLLLKDLLALHLGSRRCVHSNKPIQNKRRI